MLAIRLARTGRKNLQQFRIVVQEKARHPKSGKVVCNLGSYDPSDPENKMVFDAEKAKKYIKDGAVVSDTLARLFLKNGIESSLLEKFIKKYTKQKPKKEAEEKPAELKKEEAPAESNEENKEAPPVEEKTETKDAEEKPAEEKPAEKTEPESTEEKPA